MSNIVFGTYTKPISEKSAQNEYTDPLTQLIAATDAWGGVPSVDPDQPSFSLTVQAEDFEANKLAIQGAARALGKTARIVGVDTSARSVSGKDDKGRDTYTGTVNFSVIVTPKQKPRRGRGKAVQQAAGAEPEADQTAPDAGDQAAS